MLSNAREVFEPEPPKNEKPKEIITQLFGKYAMTTEKAEELRNMKYVVDGLIVEGYHTYLYGASGSGKTTILLNLCFEMVANGYKVCFFYLDGELFSAAKVFKETTDKKIQDKYSILIDGTMPQYLNILQSIVNKKESLKNTVFILDTFKFLSDDVNNKNANKQAMHFIKELCKLGATFISLGHTNKDGKKQSGTAEIEQDCDVLLKIESAPSVEDEDVIVSTIEKGGRCRCAIKPTTFTFKAGDPLSVNSSSDIIDVSQQAKLLQQKREDRKFITEVKTLLFNGGEKSQTELLKLLADFNLGRTKKISKLQEYTGTEWESKKGVKNATVYYLNDDFKKQWQKLD